MQMFHHHHHNSSRNFIGLKFFQRHLKLVKYFNSSLGENGERGKNPFLAHHRLRFGMFATRITVSKVPREEYCFSSERMVKKKEGV